MKIFKFTLFVFAAGALMFFSNCKKDGGEDDPTPEEEKTELLTDTWSLVSIDLPEPNATEASAWENFEVTFSASTMTASGHATSASAVWPSGGWTFSDDLGSIIREADEIEMDIITLNETSLIVTFVMPEGTEIGSKVAALNGEYTFTLEAAE